MPFERAVAQKAGPITSCTVGALRRPEAVKRAPLTDRGKELLNEPLASIGDGHHRYTKPTQYFFAGALTGGNYRGAPMRQR